jgi:hypothetical protein
MTYQVSHPYKTTRKTVLLYSSIFTILGIKLENKRFWAECWQAFPELNKNWISPRTNLYPQYFFPVIWGWHNINHPGKLSYFPPLFHRIG